MARYTTNRCDYRRAGAVRVDACLIQSSCNIYQHDTDGPTGKQTAGRTDTPSYKYT